METSVLLIYLDLEPTLSSGMPDAKTKLERPYKHLRGMQPRCHAPLQLQIPTDGTQVLSMQSCDVEPAIVAGQALGLHLLAAGLELGLVGGSTWPSCPSAFAWSASSWTAWRRLAGGAAVWAEAVCRLPATSSARQGKRWCEQFAFLEHTPTNTSSQLLPQNPKTPNDSQN